MSGNDAFEDLVFYSTNDKFYIESLQSKQIVTIDRLSHEIQVLPHTQIPLASSQKKIYGVIGVVHLIAGPYIIIITKRSKVGTINQQTIWQVDDVDVVSYSRSFASLTPQQKTYNDRYVSMITQILSTPKFYFSYTYDLTHTLQRLYYTAEEFLQMPLHERADVRFLWNHHLLRDFAVIPELNQFCLPIVHGFISVKPCIINGQWFTWILVSRRSVYRAGTRMWTRGIDKEGNVANYVETEQIIEYQDYRSSFVQTRGSIPIFWSQDPDLRYKPPPKIADCQQEEAFARHCENEILGYGKQIFVNLINKKGDEGQLEDEFRYNVINSNRQIVKDNVRYEYFDFHHECRRMRWDRLNILLDRLSTDQEQLGYFFFRAGVILREQEGVFRTNCIDCLDRTNVLQSLLARRNLQDVLLNMNILKTDQRIESQFGFELMFKNVWADNADFISIQYSGTGALKTDFTRTGKRTVLGLMKDGMNSGIRYVKNNFFDGERQDSIDLFLGKYQVEIEEGASIACPLNENRNLWMMFFPLSIFISLLMVFASYLMTTEYSLFAFLSFIFWLAMTAIAVVVTFSQGRQIVNAPKLCSTTLTSLSTMGSEFTRK